MKAQVSRRKKKVSKARSGLKISIDDSGGAWVLVVETPGGQRVTVKDAPPSIEVTDGGTSVRLDSMGVSVSSPGKVTISASQVAIDAATISVNTGMCEFAGVVKADTVIASSVVSASYTPGAGNLM